MTKKNFASENDELEDLIANIRKNNQIRIIIFGAFLALSLLLEWLSVSAKMSIMIPPIIAAVITLLLFINLISELFARKIWPKQTVKKVSLSYFIFQLIEVMALLLTIPFFEAVAFGGIALLLVYIIFYYLGFSEKIYPRILAIICVMGYVTLGFLAHYGVLEYQNIYSIGASPMLSRPFFITNISFMVGFLICLALYADIFSSRLRNSIEALQNRTRELILTQDELREAKTTLEIKVQARTDELRKLAETLDEQVKQRTKELQEKLRELEKFREVAVGRELKMIELKKEIRKVKDIGSEVSEPEKGGLKIKKISAKEQP
jgi:hypothetical protein